MKRSIVDKISPHARLILAAAIAFAVSGARSALSLSVLSVPVAILLAEFLARADGGARRVFLRRIALINKMAVLVWLFLPFTYPGERALGFISVPGALAAAVITWKLNLVAIATVRLVLGMGARGALDAMSRLRVPRKLRALTLMSAHCAALLSDGVATAWRSLWLRGPHAPLAARVKGYSAALGSALIYSTDRAHRVAMAARLRAARPESRDYPFLPAGY